jgi:hypothetical protein
VLARVDLGHLRRQVGRVALREDDFATGESKVLADGEWVDE